MLTPELVIARRRGERLHVGSIPAKQRDAAVHLAAQYLSILLEHEGASRDDASLKKVSAGLLKLLDDANEYATETDLEPPQLRRELFLHAASRRRSQRSGFDREEIINEVAQRVELTPQRLEQGLFADLRGAQILQRATRLDAEALLSRFDRAQRQAVLLRAVRVVAVVRGATPAAYRTLFQKLKFRRLLFQVEPEDDGYRFTIDGPFSLIDSVTKYGLQLALILPALEACGQLSLEAELRWGKDRRRLTYSYEHQAESTLEADAALPPDVEKLVGAIEKASKQRWSAQPGGALRNIPGVGIVAPDLTMRRDDGEVVFVEVMGFWSRDAVWRRVEMAQTGLGARFLFCVSSRLRVSESVLDEDHSALYVYKGTMNAKTICKRLDQLCEDVASGT